MGLTPEQMGYRRELGFRDRDDHPEVDEALILAIQNPNNQYREDVLKEMSYRLGLR